MSCRNDTRVVNIPDVPDWQYIVLTTIRENKHSEERPVSVRCGQLFNG